MKQINNIAAIALVTIYFIGALAFVIAEPLGIYCSFRYFGVKDGIISIFVPPYAWYRAGHFAYHGFSYHRIEFTSEEKKQLDHFIETMEKKDMAVGIILEVQEKSSETTFSLTIEQSKKYNQYLREAYNYCDKIDDATLEKIHSDLSYHFRNELCPSLRLDIESEELADGGGEINPDVIEKSIEAYKLTERFISWYNANRDDFNMPYKK